MCIITIVTDVNPQDITCIVWIWIHHCLFLKLVSDRRRDFSLLKQINHLLENQRLKSCWAAHSIRIFTLQTYQCLYSMLRSLRIHTEAAVVFFIEDTHTHTDPLPMAGCGQSCSGPFLVFADLDWDGNPVVMLRINTAALDRPAERVLRNWISCLGLPSEVEYQSGHLKRKLLVEASGRCGSGRGSQDYRPELSKIQEYPVHFFPEHLCRFLLIFESIAI